MWREFSYSNAAATVESTVGIRKTNGQTATDQWKTEIVAKASAAFHIGPKWASMGEASAELGGTFNVDFEKVVSSSTDESSAQKQKHIFPEGGQIWQWVYWTHDPCDPAASADVTTNTLVLTNSVDEKPCCPAGHAADQNNQHGPCTSVHLCSIFAWCKASVCGGLPPLPPPITAESPPVRANPWWSPPNMTMQVLLLLLLLIMITIALGRLHLRLPLFLG